MSEQPPSFTDKPATVLRKRDFRRWYVLGLVVVLILVVGFYFLPRDNTTVSPFSKTQSAAFGFPLYYPNKLPKGYHIDHESVNIPQQGVAVFVISGPAKTKIYLSEEQTPSKDVVQRFTGAIVRPEVIQTPIGTATAGTLSDKASRVGSLVTNNKTWIIVNSKSADSMSIIKFILNNLTVST